MGRIRPLAANLPLPAAGLSEEGWADAGQLVSATKRARETIRMLNDVGRTMPEVGFRRLDGHLPRGSRGRGARNRKRLNGAVVSQFEI